MDIAWQLILIWLALLLVAANGFFVLAEFAIVKVRPTRLRELADGGSRVARIAAQVVGQMDAHLAATQLGITLVSLGLGWVGTPAFAWLLEPILVALGLEPSHVAGAVAVAIAFLVITVLHVVCGELAPKSVAIRWPERAVLWCALPLRLFFRIAYPMIWVLNGAATWALGLVGLRASDEHERAHSAGELRMLFLASSQRGVLTPGERALMDRVFEFADRTVRQFMVPRPDIVYLSTGRSLDENLRVVRRHQHTRFPLCEGDVDKVIGMVHVKDLLPFERTDGPVDLVRLRREILFIPETIRGDRLLREFQQRHLHMAIVVNEYGGAAGLVTLEDVLEELVGEIQDEFDREGPLLERRDDGSYMMDGAIGLDRAAEALDVVFDDEANATQAGHVMMQLGRPAHPGDRVEIPGYEITVRGVRGLRVTKLHVTPAPAPAPAEPAAAVNHEEG